jgi:hypothetical protein
VRKKWFDRERAIEFIWQNADGDGIWHGDDASLAAEFGVSEDAAYSMLRELCGFRFVEKVYTATYAIVRWRERDEDGAGEPC